MVAVRWYLRFNLSYRDVEELLVERGVEVDHVTVFRWVQRFTPLLADAARFCRHSPGDRWYVDETYVRVNAGASLLVQGRDRLRAAASLRVADGLAVYDRPAVQASGSTVVFGRVVGRFTATVIWLFDSSTTVNAVFSSSAEGSQRCISRSVHLRSEERRVERV